MPLASPIPGYTVKQMIEKLTGCVRNGWGDFHVMIDISKPGEPVQTLARAGRGMIGIASDGSRVLVIEQGVIDRGAAIQLPAGGKHG